MPHYSDAFRNQGAAKISSRLNLSVKIGFFQNYVHSIMGHSQVFRYAVLSFAIRSFEQYFGFDDGVFR